MKTKLLLILLAIATGARAQTPDAAAIAADAERAIERAYLRASETSLAAAVQPLDAALAADPKNPALLYTRAFAYFAAIPPLRIKKNNDAMLGQFEKAIALLERVKGQPWEAEAAALHGSILGEIIGLKGGMSGMTLGPKSGRLLDRAAKALPDNPRVLLFRGTSLFSTPALFGGDAAAGMKLLQQSADIFAAAKDAAAPGPHWGRADALTWLGIAKQKAGDTAAARDAWEQALVLEPDYGWVKFGLLPSLGGKTSVKEASAEKSELVADFYLAKEAAKKTGILLLGGSEGGKPAAQWAKYFAANGYPVLAPAYFKARGLPDTLELIPLEFGDRAIARLKQQAGHSIERIVVVGASKGAELALLLAARNPGIGGVIAISPSSVVWQGLPKSFWPPNPKSSWSVHGEPVAFVPYDLGERFDGADPLAIFKLYERSLQQAEAVAPATIEVEKIHGPVLLLSGRDDALWPSTKMADAIRERLAARGFAYASEHVSYPDAGHTLDEHYLIGGTPEGNRAAHSASATKMLEFLAAADRSLAAGIAGR